MEIKQTNSNITYTKTVKEYDFTITNEKGEEMKIMVETYLLNSETDGYDSDTKYFNAKGDIIENFDEVMQKFIGDNEDIDDLNDLIETELK